MYRADGPAEMHAVVTVLERNEFGAITLALELPVLPGDLQRALDGVRTAAAKTHARHAIGLHHLHQPLRKFDRARMAGAAEAGVESQFVELVGDGLFYFGPAVAKVDVPQAADAVNHAMAVGDIAHVGPCADAPSGAACNARWPA